MKISGNWKIDALSSAIIYVDQEKRSKLFLIFPFGALFDVVWFVEEFGKSYTRIFVWWLVSLGGVTRGAWNAGNGAREWAWNAGEWAADCVWSMKRRRVNARICSFDAMIMLRTYAFRDYNSRNFNIGLPNLVHLHLEAVLRVIRFGPIHILANWGLIGPDL